MHRCLQIAEIQRMICDQLKDEAQDHGHDQAIERALAALARTSTSWSAVALDSLWSRIWGLSPLIKCMSRDLWQVGNGNITFRRPLKGSDLEVLQKYTSRVQELLMLRSTREATLDSRACQILLMAFSRRPLLPNLRKLCWESTASHLLTTLPLFLTNKLKTLKLAVSHSSIEQYTLLAVTLSNLAPEVAHLTLLASDAISLERIGLSEAIRQWQEITTLDVGQSSISLDDLLCIASMPKLTSLNMGSLQAFRGPSSPTNSGDFTSLNAISSLHPPFPVLRYLSLSDTRQESLPDITRFIGALQGASLSTLSITGGMRESSMNHLLELFRKIEQHCNHGTLHKIHLKTNINTRLATLFSVFSPLLRFAALETVHLHVSPAITITEDEASQIAASWPRLSALKLLSPGSQSQPRQGIKTTLSSLLPLARGCPSLSTLYVHLDASDSNTYKLLVEHPETFKGIRNRSLRTLGVGQSWISNKEFVAMFLSEIFPNVKILNDHNGYAHHDGLKHGRRWGYIDRVLLPLVRGAWRHENEYLGIKDSVTGHSQPLPAEQSDLLEDDESYLSFGWRSD